MICFSKFGMVYYLRDIIWIMQFKQSGAKSAPGKHFERGYKYMSHKYVYLFTEGNGSMRELLGGKGANLAEMTNIGLPVPQGFTISTEACTKYYEDGRQINADIQAEIMEYVEKLEAITGKKFGDKENPLLVSVRSGARASMPGMMDTILNLGLNEDVVEVMAPSPATPVGLMTATAASSRCTPMSLWKSARSTSRL